MSDLIRRDDVIELVKNSYYNLAGDICDVEAIIDDVEKLPTYSDQTVRLIDADAMIADLLTVNPQYQKSIDWCIRVVKAQPSVTQWIPVTERLPNHSNSVLVSCETRSGVKSVSKAFYFRKQWSSDCGLLSEVKAWMPLPEPYEENANDGNRK